MTSGARDPLAAVDAFGATWPHFEVDQTLAADDRVVQLWSYTWAGGHVRGVDVFRTRDGKIAEKLSYVKG